MPEVNTEFLKLLLSGKYKQEEQEHQTHPSEPPESTKTLPQLKRDEELEQLPIDLLEDFPDNPIPPYKADEMTELIDSIRSNGVLEPLIVRQFGKGFQIINGRNRRNAARLLGYNIVPCVVRNLNDDDAAIQLFETIFTQRNVSRISIMQKAQAYRLWLEALKRQGRRTDLSSRQVGAKLESADIIGEESGESGRQIQRYIRLTYLVPELQDKVDEGKTDFSFSAAVLVSFLSEVNQATAYQFFFLDHGYGISIKAAGLLREQDSAGTVFDQDSMSQLWESLNPKDETDEDNQEDIVLPYKKIRHFFPPHSSSAEIEKLVFKLLAQYFNSEKKKGENVNGRL